MDAALRGKRKPNFRRRILTIWALANGILVVNEPLIRLGELGGFGNGSSE